MWEVLAKVIIYITKALFKFLMLAVLILLFLNYTNVGGSMDALKSKYYSLTGSDLSPESVMVDLNGRVNDSMHSMDNVSDIVGKQNQLVQPK